MIAGGIDTVFASQVPTGQNLGLLMRVDFTRNECGRPHSIEIIMQDEDGKRLVQLTGTITPEWNTDWPHGWKAKALLPFNFGVQLEKHGIYEIVILIGDSEVKNIQIRVAAPQEDS